MKYVNIAVELLNELCRLVKKLPPEFSDTNPANSNTENS